MVAEQLERAGITDPRVLDAMRTLPRHRFVPLEQAEWAYEDRPLPIGEEQTISQPYIVAYMTQSLQLKETDRVLEVGTGSGYQTALLAMLARRVFSMEIRPALAEVARRRIGELGLANWEIRPADGYEGWPEAAPFDAVIVTAAPPELPRALLDQLVIGGRFISPVGRTSQDLWLVAREPDRFVEERLIPVMFVPMVSRAEYLPPR